MSVPYRLANGIGNLPDAIKFMANYDYLEAIARGSFISNGGFENWNGGTSFSNPADAAALADSWVLSKTGTSLPTVDVSREATVIDAGVYAMKANITGAGSANSVWSVQQTVSNHLRFKTLTLAFGMKVKCATASKIRISITDGVNTAYSAYHTGGGTYELLQAVLTFDSTPTTFKVTIDVVSDFTEAIYFDSGYAYVIPPQMESASRLLLAFSTLYQGFLELTGGTLSGILAMGGNKITGLGAATVAGDAVRYEQVAGYRRPVLVYASATAVDVENNTGIANETKIIFPDLNVRSVTEDVSSAHKYRRFTITAAAEFTTGTEDSGLFAGESEADNTWYAIYAVKSLIDATKFVLVGSTVLPVQANFATLNTNFGTNGWVYLGMIRNGDNSGTTGDILSFIQVGNMTLLTNTCIGNVKDTMGIRLASTASAGSLTWTYSAGTGAAQIPSHIKIARMSFGVKADTAYVAASTSYSNNVLYFHGDASQQSGVTTVWSHVTSGFYTGVQTGHAGDINISGWIDRVLGVGQNPVL